METETLPVEEYTYIPLNQRISAFEGKVAKENASLAKPDKHNSE